MRRAATVTTNNDKMKLEIALYSFILRSFRALLVLGNIGLNANLEALVEVLVEPKVEKHLKPHKERRKDKALEKGILQGGRTLLQNFVANKDLDDPAGGVDEKRVVRGRGRRKRKCLRRCRHKVEHNAK